MRATVWRTYMHETCAQARGIALCKDSQGRQDANDAQHASDAMQARRSARRATLPARLVERDARRDRDVERIEVVKRREGGELRAGFLYGV